MRSAVVLLGFLLASAQAFYIPANTRTTLSAKPSFFGQTVAGHAPATRATLVASLEDIEKRLIEQEKAKTATAKKESAPQAPAPKAPKAKKAPAPAPKAKPAVGEWRKLMDNDVSGVAHTSSRRCVQRDIHILCHYFFFTISFT